MELISDLSNRTILVVAGSEGSYDSPSDFDVFIAFRKEKQFATAHLISHFVFVDRLTHAFKTFALSLDLATIPNTSENNMRSVLKMCHRCRDGCLV